MTSATPNYLPLQQVSDLMTPGKPLPFNVLDSGRRLLLAAGQCVMDVKQLQALLERGACVSYVEVAAARTAQGSASAAAGGMTPSSRKRSVFDLWEQRTWALDALLRQVGRDTTLAPQIEAFADEHIVLIDRHIDAALFVTIRQDDKRFVLYPLTHALHTATVALLCARQMGWESTDLRCTVLTSLTMNVAIGELQAQMAEQADPPTKRQLDQIRSHPHRSAQMLRDSGVTDADWLGAVEDHHERNGGKGYPRGLDEVSKIAGVVRAADVFMAKISPRALRPSMLPQMAARQLFQEEGVGSVAGALIKAVGVYPPGDYVRLRNGEAAIVAQRAVSGNTPLVVSILDAAGKRLHGAPRRDTSVAEFAITGPLIERAGLPRVLPEQVFGMIDA